jgi:hypothetical protein
MVETSKKSLSVIQVLLLPQVKVWQTQAKQQFPVMVFLL